MILTFLVPDLSLWKISLLLKIYDIAYKIVYSCSGNQGYIIHTSYLRTMFRSGLLIFF